MVGHQITLFFAYSILENNNLTNNTNAHTHIRNRKEEMYIREEVKKKEGGWWWGHQIVFSTIRAMLARKPWRHEDVYHHLYFPPYSKFKLVLFFYLPNSNFPHLCTSFLSLLLTRKLISSSTNDIVIFTHLEPYSKVKITFILIPKIMHILSPIHSWG